MVHQSVNIPESCSIFMHLGLTMVNIPCYIKLARVCKINVCSGWLIVGHYSQLTADHGLAKLK